MDLFFWKKNTQIDNFASNAANDFFSTVNPEVAFDYFNKPAQKKDKSKIHKKTNQAFANLIKRVDQFKTLHALGVYGKARLHLKFRLRLEELGYDPVTIDKINQHLLVNTA